MRDVAKIYLTYSWYYWGSMVGEQKQQNDDSIKKFVDKYDGDIEAAVAALQNYARNIERKRKHVPSGRVLISVKNVKKQYKIHKNEVMALNDVSVDIHEGEFIALTGTSGSGKSTLLQLIGGLDRATHGTITLDGTNLNDLKDADLSRFRNSTIGFVFQFFYLQPFLKLNQNIEVPGMFAHMSRSERKKRVAELADAVGLGDRIDHLPKELSGGQMQRAAIARALLNKPKILLADEPTGNLDSTNTDAIIALFDTIRIKYGTTIVMVTHDKSLAKRADREITLKDGVVV